MNYNLKFPNLTANLDLQFIQYLRFGEYQDMSLPEILAKVFPYRRVLSEIVELFE